MGSFSRVGNLGREDGVVGIILGKRKSVYRVFREGCGDGFEEFRVV